jgi:hypothetical protein
MILAIHDSMINVTNHIVEHVFVEISRSQGSKNTTCQNEKIVYFSRVKTEKRKEKKRHCWMNRRYLEGSVSVYVGALGTLHEGRTQHAPSDEPTVWFLHASDDWEKQSNKRQ